ncbi:MAG: hypothetical protein KDD38_10805, partial [Bdellovibrionales bacterium]|nr:hypothetical protein [Bdellovibrionales bacterium]
MSECNRVKSKSVKALLTFFASLVFLDIAVAGEILHLQSGDVTLAELNNKSNFSLRAIDTNSSKLINSQYFILQFQNAITQQDENALREEGLEILRYVPDDAYLVRGVEGQILVLQNKMQNLKGYVPYQPSIRLSPDLKVRSVFNRDALQTVSVQLFAGVDAEQVAEELSAQGILVSTVSGSNIE